MSDWVVIPLMGKEMEKKGKAGWRREKNEAFNSEHTAFWSTAKTTLRRSNSDSDGRVERKH